MQSPDYLPAPPSSSGPQVLRGPEREHTSLRWSKRSIVYAVLGAVLWLAAHRTYSLNSEAPARAQDQVRIDQSRRLLGDDTLRSLWKAADQLGQVIRQNPKDTEALAMDALAHLGAARYGMTSKLRIADERLSALALTPANSPR